MKTTFLPLLLGLAAWFFVAAVVLSTFARAPLVVTPKPRGAPVVVTPVYAALPVESAGK